MRYPAIYPCIAPQILYFQQEQALQEELDNREVEFTQKQRTDASVSAARMQEEATQAETEARADGTEVDERLHEKWQVTMQNEHLMEALQHVQSVDRRIQFLRSTMQRSSEHDQRQFLSEATFLQQQQSLKLSRDHTQHQLYASRLPPEMRATHTTLCSILSRQEGAEFMLREQHRKELFELRLVHRERNLERELQMLAAKSALQAEHLHSRQRTELRQEADVMKLQIEARRENTQRMAAARREEQAIAMEQTLLAVERRQDALAKSRAEQRKHMSAAWQSRALHDQDAPNHAAAFNTEPDSAFRVFHDVLHSADQTPNELRPGSSKDSGSHHGTSMSSRPSKVSMPTVSSSGTAGQDALTHLSSQLSALETVQQSGTISSAQLAELQSLRVAVQQLREQKRQAEDRMDKAAVHQQRAVEDLRERHVRERATMATQHTDELHKLAKEWGTKDAAAREAQGEAVSELRETHAKALAAQQTQFQRERADLVRTMDGHDTALASAKKEGQIDFLAFICHEIRNPLTTVTGLIDMLRMDEIRHDEEDERSVLGSPTASTMRGSRCGGGGSRASDATEEHTLSHSARAMHLTAMANEAELMRIILNDVLDLAKIEAGQIKIFPEPFDVVAAVAAIVQSNKLAMSAKRPGSTDRVEMRLDAPGPSLMWCNDPQRFRQIIHNLVGNAVKFTSAGHIAVSIQQVLGEAGDQRLRVSVADTGCGISTADIALLFQPFSQGKHRLKGQHGGTGLGLTICRKLAECMGGSVDVHSTVGEGSEFWVELPWASSGDAPDSSASDDDSGAESMPDGLSLRVSPRGANGKAGSVLSGRASLCSAVAPAGMSD